MHALLRLDDLLYWIRERHNIYMKKQAGEPKPWTDDPVLQGYRFCNVYRELDTVTQWITQNWRRPNASHPDLWFMMVVARLVNWPDTLAEMGSVMGDWDPQSFVNVLHGRRARGLKVFGGAYIVSTNGRTMDKAEYLAKHVLDPLWADRQVIRPYLGDTLESFHGRLMQHDGMGSFMAAQVVADVKYTMPLAKAHDWWTWAASGPGSRRGLNRLLGRNTDAPWREAEWRAVLAEVHERLDHEFQYTKDFPQIHAQDLQNCLCEFDKYLRTRQGEGRPRATYDGGVEE